MPNVKVMDPVEASLSDPYLPPEECINQVGEIAKLSNSNSWKFLTKFVLDGISAPYVGTK